MIIRRSCRLPCQRIVNKSVDDLSTNLLTTSRRLVDELVDDLLTKLLMISRRLCRRTCWWLVDDLVNELVNGQSTNLLTNRWRVVDEFIEVSQTNLSKLCQRICWWIIDESSMRSRRTCHWVVNQSFNQTLTDVSKNPVKNRQRICWSLFRTICLPIVDEFVVESSTNLSINRR